MVIKIYDNPQQIGRAAATLFAAQVLRNPQSVLGFATGSTPLPTYQVLVEMAGEGLLDFSQITTFNLDEYVGLPKTHDQSYHYFMHDNLFDKINLNPERIHILSGTAPDVEAECAAYEDAITAAGGIDLQILGIGENGHIAFNEPDGDFSDKTHRVKLTESTIEANKRFFDSAADVPREALTMGIGTIMRARGIVLIATGEKKIDAVYGLAKGPITPQCPASILQLHPEVTVLIDRAAAARL